MLFILVTLLLAGCGTPSFLITPVANVRGLQEIQVQPGEGWFPPRIAIIEIEGLLLNARTGGFLQPTENKLSLFNEQLEQAEKDPSVKAIVLRVNSPGGTVAASDTMYQQLVRFRQRTRKPVVASAQDVTASGAYYVCCGADRIVVHPTSVIGSIGVIFNTFNLEGTLAKVGARVDPIKSGPLKDIGSPFRGLSPEERQVMQGMVDEYHARFVGVVTAHRPMNDPAKLELITDGRVFSGEQAVQLGLADGTGLLEDAIELAKELAGTPNAKVVMYKRPYGYRGSIYAAQTPPTPQANVLHLDLPPSRAFLPAGFYYLWEP